MFARKLRLTLRGEVAARWTFRGPHRPERGLHFVTREVTLRAGPVDQKLSP